MEEGKVFSNYLDIDKIIELVFFDGSDDADEEAERIREEHVAPYKKLFEALIIGKIDSFDFLDDGLWYIVTRSTRPEVLVQASVILLKDGDIIPISHHNVNTFHDLEEIIPNEKMEIRWRKNPKAKAA